MANKSKQESNYDLDKNVTAIFDVRKTLGKGAYGIVWKAIDKRQRDTVALKKIYDAFRDATDAQRTYREVIFLRAFRHHPNIIRLLGIYRAANNMDFYLVFEHMESDLHIVIKKGDILKDIHRQFVMYQLVNAIKYVHSGNVIHRDLKPSNILIDSKCRLKVGDFGLARTLSAQPNIRSRNASTSGNGKGNGHHETDENEEVMSDYVATRWYRAPEILVGCRKYTKSVDMWSLGCILGEMITEQPIFQGSNTINQMEKILTALPNVTQRDIDNIGKRFGSSLLNRTIRRDYQHSLHAMFRGCSANEIGFTTSLLMLDPNDRISANKALKHPFVSSFRCPSAEMDMRLNVQPPLRDDHRFALNDYRSSLYEMISKELSSVHRNTQSSRAATGSKDRRELAFGCRTGSLSTLPNPSEIGPNSPRNKPNRIVMEPKTKNMHASREQLLSHSQPLSQAQPQAQPQAQSQAQSQAQAQAQSQARVQARVQAPALAPSQTQAQAQALEELPKRSHHNKHSSHHVGPNRHSHSPPTHPQRADGERTLQKGHRSHMVVPQREYERPVAVTTPRLASQSKVKVREKDKIQSQARAYVETQAIGKHKQQVHELVPQDWVEKLIPTNLAVTQDTRETRAESGLLKPLKERSSKQKLQADPKSVHISAKHGHEQEYEQEHEPQHQKEPIMQKESLSLMDHDQYHKKIQRKARKREEELLESSTRSDKSGNERSFLLEALLRQKKRESPAQAADMDARVQANLDRLQAERKKMQKKILKYAAETGLMFISDTSKTDLGSDGSKTVYTTDSESYFTPKCRKSVMKKPLMLKKYKGNREVKKHGNSIAELHEHTSSRKFKKHHQQSHDVFDASERNGQQVDHLSQEISPYGMEKDSYDSLIHAGDQQYPYDTDSSRRTPGKQHTVLKPMFLHSIMAAAPAPAQALPSTHKLKEPRRRKITSGDNFQPLHQRYIRDIQVARVNDD